MGKDLTKFCVPVYFNEPISMLQKMAEFMEYGDLLELASAEESSLLRLALVATHTISHYNSSESRTTKPFNPVLGETFELKTDKWRFFGEQVSHHPPISACFVES